MEKLSIQETASVIRGALFIEESRDFNTNSDAK